MDKANKIIRDIISVCTENTHCGECPFWKKFGYDECFLMAEKEEPPIGWVL